MSSFDSQKARNVLSLKNNRLFRPTGQANVKCIGVFSQTEYTTEDGNFPDPNPRTQTELSPLSLRGEHVKFIFTLSGSWHSKDLCGMKDGVDALWCEHVSINCISLGS